MVKSTGRERINMLMNDSKPITWLLGLLLTVVVAGCGSGGGGTTAQPGTLGVSLTDAPACGFDEVNVTVSKVRVHQTNTDNVNAAGWSDIVLDPPKRINLLEYNDPTKNNGALLPLGDISLPSGHYTQVRLVLIPHNGSIPPNNSVVLSDTKQSNLLLLDEPTASMDPHAKREVESLMHDFAAQNMTLVFSSHNLGQVKRLATHVAYLEHGKLLAYLPVGDFFDSDKLYAVSPAADAFLKGETT